MTGTRIADESVKYGPYLVSCLILYMLRYSKGRMFFGILYSVVYVKLLAHVWSG